MTLRTTVGALIAAFSMTVGVAGAASPEDAPDLARGAELFELCAQCHGSEAHGNRLFLAPAIAGLSQWYIEMQLDEFRQGLRGLHFDGLAERSVRVLGCGSLLLVVAHVPTTSLRGQP